MTERMAKAAAYQSTTTPVPVAAYKPTTPPAVSGFINALKEAAAAVTRKAKIIAAITLEKLNVSGIRAFLAKVLAIRNSVMNIVSKAVSWVSAAATGIKNLISDTVQGLKNLVDDLNALVKSNPFYKLANTLCAGIDLTGIANQIKAIQTRLDMDSILDYILENNDDDLLRNLKNCQVFNKESVKKLKDACEHLFDKSNVMMLACMADKVDYWDVASVDRKLRKAASYMTDDDSSISAIDEIVAYMHLNSQFAILMGENRFTTLTVYDGEAIKTMQTTVPKYLKHVASDQGEFIAKAMQYV